MSFCYIETSGVVHVQCQEEEKLMSQKVPTRMLDKFAYMPYAWRRMAWQCFALNKFYEHMLFCHERPAYMRVNLSKSLDKAMSLFI